MIFSGRLRIIRITENRTTTAVPFLLGRKIIPNLLQCLN